MRISCARCVVLVILTIVFIGMLGVTGYAVGHSFCKVSMAVDKQPVVFEEKSGLPVITTTERMLVQIRIVSENMGYKVEWSEETWHKGIQKIWINDAKTNVEFDIGSTTALVNGKTVNIDEQDGKPVETKAMLIGDRTYVPLRFVSEALGGTIEYEMRNGVHIIDIFTGKEIEPVQTGNIEFNPVTDVYEDGRMSEEKTLEYLDELIKSVKVYKENGKYYLKYDHIEVPEGFSVGVRFETNLNNTTTTPGYALTTGTAYLPQNQLPRNQSFVKELNKSKMIDVRFYIIQLNIANPNSTNSSGDTTSAMYSISYYPKNNSLNGITDYSQIIRYNKWGSPIETKPFDKDLIFGPGL